MEGCLWDRGKARHRLPTRCGADSNSDDPSLLRLLLIVLIVLIFLVGIKRIEWDVVVDCTGCAGGCRCTVVDGVVEGGEECAGSVEEGRVGLDVFELGRDERDELGLALRGRIKDGMAK